MKKIILVALLVFFSVGSTVNASSLGMKRFVDLPKIALVLTGDQNLFTEKRIADEIFKKINERFPINNYTVIEDKKVLQELLIMVENLDNPDIVNVDQLKQKDFVAAGAKFGYDYLMVLPFYNNGGYYTTSGWSNMVSQNITLRARIVDVKKGEYLYRLDVTEQGETGNAFGSPSLVRAQKEAISKCLDNVFKDLDIGDKKTSVGDKTNIDAESSQKNESKKVEDKKNDNKAETVTVYKVVMP